MCFQCCCFLVVGVVVYVGEGSSRLHVYGVDFRSTPLLIEFLNYFKDTFQRVR